ncbi:stage II sporulation protein M [Streptomonospora litoralis]|uniref:Stage II sporulation protein M n=1 Tax=Streptomonospora litoralis TaxID=2498135 RepID=A0A4P6Q907_9ACTN|nr:stage II sporulation protein M [Streptomonospora litoralis]QBI55769.1 hypothetical protein EKD16_20030 [Streptomonospora litoralis]
MRFLRTPFRIIRANLGAYLVINALVYGVFLLGMGTAMVFPELSAAETASLQEDGTADLVASLLGNVWLFSLTIFAVNTLTVAVPMILLPSMVVPFAGIAAFLYKAFTLGISLAPQDETLATMMIPHSLTVLIEFQAYVLIVLGAYLLGRSWLHPGTVGARNRRQGYLRGLRQVGWMSLPALALFVVGAVYEAVEIIYLLPPLLAG